VGGGVQLGALDTAATNGLLCQPRVMLREKLVKWLAGKTCPSAALSATNTICCPDANPGRRGERPASNRLSYGTAKYFGFPWQFSLHWVLYTHLSTWASTIGHIVADLPSGLSLNPSQNITIAIIFLSTAIWNLLILFPWKAIAILIMYVSYWYFFIHINFFLSILHT
jgi:hypothetical protein